MYKPTDISRHSFLDFNQPMGLLMNPNNRWVKMADRIPWDEFETKYAGLLPKGTENVAKPLRMALGALIIQMKFQYSDRELMEQIIENSYLQYFIVLPGYQEQTIFDASALVLFHKRITMELVMETNKSLLFRKNEHKGPPSQGLIQKTRIRKENRRTREFCPLMQTVRRPIPAIPSTFFC